RAGAGAGRDRGGESPLRVYLGVLRLDGRAVDETAVADVARRGLPFRTDGRPDASWRSADGRMHLHAWHTEPHQLDGATGWSGTWCSPRARRAPVTSPGSGRGWRPTSTASPPRPARPEPRSSTTPARPTPSWWATARCSSTPSPTPRDPPPISSGWRAWSPPGTP